MENQTVSNPGPQEPKRGRLSVLAIISTVLGFLIIVPVVSGIAAIVLGIVSLYSIAVHKPGLRGRGFAITGIVLGLIQLIVAMILLIGAMFLMTVGLPERFYFHDTHLGSSPKKYYGESVNTREFNIANNKALAAQHKGRSKEALNYFSSALRIAKKEEGIAHYGIGSVYMDLKKYDNALIEFDQAIADNPNLFDAYQNKAVTLRLMGRFQDSIDACKKTVLLFPDFARAYCSMGWAYESLGNYKEAVNAHLEAIRLAPHWAFPKQKINFCLSMLKDEQLNSQVREKIQLIESDAQDSENMD